MVQALEQTGRIDRAEFIGNLPEKPMRAVAVILVRMTGEFSHRSRCSAQLSQKNDLSQPHLREILSPSHEIRQCLRYCYGMRTTRKTCKGTGEGNPGAGRETRRDPCRLRKGAPLEEADRRWYCQTESSRERDGCNPRCFRGMREPICNPV